MITGRNLLTSIGLEFKFYHHVIFGVKVPYEGFLTPMVDIRN